MTLEVQRSRTPDELLAQESRRYAKRHRIPVEVFNAIDHLVFFVYDNFTIAIAKSRDGKVLAVGPAKRRPDDPPDCERARTIATWRVFNSFRDPKRSLDSLDRAKEWLSGYRMQ